MSKVFSLFASLHPFWQLLSHRRRRQLLALQVLSIAAALAEVANLGALLPFLRLLANPSEGLRSIGPLGTLFSSMPTYLLLPSLGLSFMVVVVLSSGLRVATIWIQYRFAALIGSDLGAQVFQCVLYRPYSWHMTHNTSQTLGHVTKDVDVVVGTFQNILGLLINIPTVVLLGFALTLVAPTIMPIVVILLGVFYWIIFILTRSSQKRDGKLAAESFQKGLQAAQEGLGGIRDVILDGTQSFFEHAFDRSNRKGRLLYAAISVKSQAPRFLIEGFSMVLIVGIALFLAIVGQGVSQQLPMLGTLALGAYRILQPLQQCFAAASLFQANQASVNRILPFLRPNSQQSQSSLPCSDVEFSTASIIFHDVSFTYPQSDRETIHKLYVDITPGSRLGLVGTTGSGKSTLTDLILGLLKPTSGSISINGRDLHSTPDLLQAWHKSVAHVPQHIYLTDASFASNIAFGVPEDDIDYDLVRTAAHKAKISQMIESLPYAYNQFVGERGVKLSGGQRQRIGIARALYKTASLLVLDEATSALDNQTESDVIDAIKRLDRSLTLVIVAHRLSTVHFCDRIIMLENGRLIASGSFEDLLESSDSFRALATHQSHSS